MQVLTKVVRVLTAKLTFNRRLQQDALDSNQQNSLGEKIRYMGINRTRPDDTH